MRHVDYFKLQAKNLFKDFRSNTQKHFPDDAEFVILYEYGYDEKDVSLMRAQHIIARMSGFRKWTDLASAPETELKVAKLLYDNRDVINIEDWEMYVARVEREHKIILDPESKLEILEQVWLNGDFMKKVNKYAESALIAANYVFGEKLEPEAAWKKATQQVFNGKATKGCPKGAFLGLVTKTRSGKNAGYALDALAILKKNSKIDYKPMELWRELGLNISHNSQMNVLLALWNNKQFREYLI